MSKKTVYMCDLCPPVRDPETKKVIGQPEVKGMMHTVKLVTVSQGQERAVEVDSCGACKDRFFPLSA